MPVFLSAMMLDLEGEACLLVTAQVDPGQVERSVSEQGHGMSPAVQTRAMEPFFTTKPQGKDTGLVLPSVYCAMKAHGGTVELRSRAGIRAKLAECRT